MSAAPRPLRDAPPALLGGVRVLFSDLDDTITTGGRIERVAFDALWRAAEADLAVVIVTGGPAGAGETLARLLPVAAAVAESGAVWYWRAKDGGVRAARALDEDATAEARRVRARLLDEVPRLVPGARPAHDQAWRDVDVAFEVAPAGTPLPEEAIARVERLCAEAGLRTGRSSIHVNAWPAAYDKITGARAAVRDALGLDLDALVAGGGAAYAGDALNDAPAFAHFPISIAVANVAAVLDRLPARPAWITRAAYGDGFAEVIAALGAARAAAHEAARAVPRDAKDR